MQATSKQTRSIRMVIVGGISSSSAILVVLIALALFVIYPQVMTTGDANLQRWIGPDAARLAFTALALAIALGATWLAITTTRDATWAAWLPGAGFGSAIGLAAALLYVLLTGLTSSAAGLAIVLAGAGLVLGPLVVGFVASHPTARTSAGAIAGFWFALALAILTDVGLIAGDLLFGSRLAQTVWADYTSGDPLCNHVHGTTLLGCAVGDDLGFATTLLIFGPLLGLGLGTLAGLIGRVSASHGADERTATSWIATFRLIATMSVFLAVIVVAELAGNLW